MAMAAPKAAAAALKQTGEDIADIASQLAPVDTGKLRDSYKSEEVSETTVRIGTDVEYAPHVEFGTYNSASQPHLIPAFAQTEATFKTRLADEMKALK